MTIHKTSKAEKPIYHVSVVMTFISTQGRAGSSLPSAWLRAGFWEVGSHVLSECVTTALSVIIMTKIHISYEKKEKNS